jgi:hypothetical protein
MRIPPKPGRVLAYRVIWQKHPDQVGIVAARTKGMAISATVLAIHDAGYKPGFFEMRARRAPEFDSWAARQPPGRIGKLVSEETAKNERTAILEQMELFPGGRPV